MRLVAVGQDEQYLCASRPATVGSSVGMRPGLSDVTVVWERIELPYERVALRTPYGRFLSCRSGEGGPWMTLADDLGPREAFEEILWPDGDVSFRTYELTFLAASGLRRGKESVVTAREVESQGSARFRYLDPPPSLVERALEIVDGQPQVPDMPRQFAHSAESLRDSSNGNSPG